MQRTLINLSRVTHKKSVMEVEGRLLRELASPVRRALRIESFLKALPSNPATVQSSVSLKRWNKAHNRTVTVCARPWFQSHATQREERGGRTGEGVKGDGRNENNEGRENGNASLRRNGLYSSHSGVFAQA